jgi:parallel beta-helix repeat protein
MKTLTYLSLPLVLLAAACGTSVPDECTVVLSPSGDVQEKVQMAFIDAKAGDVICFEEGTYRFTGELSLGVQNVKLRGVSENPKKSVLDWKGQTTGSRGMNVTADGFTIEYLTIKDAKGDGIRVTGAERITFRHLFIYWEAGSVKENGTYAIFPVECDDVLIEHNEVVGAADAGIYIGQSDRVIARNNVLYRNVQGFSIENSTDVEIYDNEIYENAGGLSVFNLPNLPRQDGRRVLIRNNVLRDNNHDNFGPDGAIVSVIPSGTGMIIMAVDQVEIRDNTISNHQTTAMAIASLLALDGVYEFTPDPDHDAYAEGIYIHSNTITMSGYAPEGVIAAATTARPIEDILWDGYVDGDKDNSDGSLSVCIKDNGAATYRHLDLPNEGTAAQVQDNDVSRHDCTLPPLSSVTPW